MYRTDLRGISERQPPMDSGPVLLLGDYRPALTLARVLRREGRRVIVAGGADEGATGWSRHCEAVLDLADPDADPTGFLDGLQRILAERPDIRVVLPLAESYVRTLATHAGALPSDVLLASPPAAAVGACLHKPALYTRAQDLGVPVAPFAIVRDHAALFAAADEVGYPMVVRPLASTRRIDGQKALVIEDGDALFRALPVWPKGQDGLLIQRKVEGPRHNLYFAAHRGRLIRLCEARILRTDRPDGTGLAVEGVTMEPDPGRLAHAAALVGDLDYTGVGCIQFLVEPGGASWLLEINPRIAGNHSVPEAAGLGLGRLAIRLAAGYGGEERLVVGRPGLRYAWTTGDLGGVRWLARSGASSADVARAALTALRTLCAADIHMTWSWTDPMPTVALIARGLTRRKRQPAALQPVSRRLGRAG